MRQRGLARDLLAGDIESMGAWPGSTHAWLALLLLVGCGQGEPVGARRASVVVIAPVLLNAFAPIPGQRRAAHLLAIGATGIPGPV